MPRADWGHIGSIEVVYPDQPEQAKILTSLDRETARIDALISKTDFCGVDVMVDKDGNSFVLEVNSAPSMTSDYRQSVFAKAFDWIIEKGNDYMNTEVCKRWRDVAHPAILPAD